MLDLLLVDDEKSVLEAMANTIRWEKLRRTVGRHLWERYRGSSLHGNFSLRCNYYRRENASGRWYRDDKAAKEMGIKAEFVILSGFTISRRCFLVPFFHRKGPVK